MLLSLAALLDRPQHNVVCMQLSGCPEHRQQSVQSAVLAQQRALTVASVLCELHCSAETPFALRWLAAELPAWQGDPAAAIAAHCRLLDDCVRLLPAAPADDIDLSGTHHTPSLL